MSKQWHYCSAIDCNSTVIKNNSDDLMECHNKPWHLLKMIMKHCDKVKYICASLKCKPQGSLRHEKV